jgi:hypothetical protein
VLRIIPLVLLAALCLGDAAFPQEILFNASLFYLTDYGSNSVFCTDLDGDGHRDLVTCNYSADNVSVLLNDGQGLFLEAVDYQVGDQPFSVFCGDLDGDGDLDLVTSNYYTTSRFCSTSPTLTTCQAMPTETAQSTWATW